MNSNMTQQAVSAAEFFIYTLSELAILFLLISIFVSYINHKLPPETIKKVLAGNRGYGIAVSLGAVTPFCSCSTLPMTIGLLKARAAFGPVMTFLFTSPLLNPFIVGLFVVSFGFKITVIYSLFVVMLAVFSGALLQYLNFDRFIKRDLFESKAESGCGASDKSTTSNCGISNETKTSSGGSSCDTSDEVVEPKISECNQTPAQDKKLNYRKLIKESFSQFVSFLPYMMLGVGIGAVLHGFVPASFFSELSTTNVYLLIPTAAIIGVFLYVRASTMVPIALSLSAKGMSMGAIMSLTIGGAGASLPEMVMLKRLFQWPLLFAFILLVFTTACLTGLAIELI